MDEREILKSSFRYLRNLGYQETQILPHVPIEDVLERSVADIVVYEGNQPYIVVENKSNISEKKNDPDYLKFHPYVRQLQAMADTLNAPYYLLTDGVSFLWFTTDMSGRPQLLNNAVYPVKQVEKQSHVKPSKEVIVQTLRSLQRYFSNFRERTHINEEIGLVLLAKLLSERGDDALKHFLLHKQSIPQIALPFHQLLDSVDLDQQNLIEAFELLDTLPFTHAESRDLLGALDETLFVKSNINAEQRVARWLADYLYHLSGIRSHNENIVLNIFSGFGEILAAIGLESKETELWGINSSPIGALWTQLQLVVLGRKQGSTILEPRPVYNTLHLQQVPIPTHIVFVPPFGKVDRHERDSFLSSLGVRQSEDLYLELAIKWVKPGGRIVMLIPEGMLFAGGKRRATREFIRDNTRITAIISLDSGAFRPYKNLKTNVLVLDKEPHPRDYNVFMAQIEGKFATETFNSLTDSRLSEMLGTFEQWSMDQRIQPNSRAWTIAIDDLDNDNWTVSRYNPIRLSEYDQWKSQYQTFLLKQLAQSIKRGANIKLDTEGSIRIIGPSAIRPMLLDTENLGQALEAELPAHSPVVQTGDVLINNISTYLGSAAVVNEELTGCYISSHVMLIRPDISQVLPEYLAATINNEYIKQQILKRATGSIMPSLTTANLEDIAIPLPSLEIQQRITSRIKKAQNEVSEAKKQLDVAEHRFLSILQNLSEED